MNTYQIIEAFKASMREADVEPPDKVLADGVLHRFHIAGQKQGSLNGAYKLHLDGIKPAGYFEDFKTGIKTNWKSDSPAKPFTQAERLQQENAKKARDQQQAQRYEQTATLAQRLLDAAKPLTGNDHPYLLKKRVDSYGLYRLKVWSKRYKNEAGQWMNLNIQNVLLVPLIDINGKLWNLQAIFPETDRLLRRDKDFLSGGRLGGLFHVIGQPTDDVIICEGYATGASLYAATGSQVLCALSAGNLLHVAKAVRTVDCGKKIIIAADNDEKTPGNPGLTAAKKTALAVGGFWPYRQLRVILTTSRIGRFRREENTE